MEVHITELFESLPNRFRKEKAGNYSAIFHFDIPDHPYTVEIGQGICQVSQGLNGKADCKVKTKAKFYTAIETGKMNPQTALLTRKLKVSNLPEMMKFAGLFRRFNKELSAATQRPTQQGPLAGIRILDLSRLLPAPLGTQMMAAMGAEVIKIEDPNRPDETRNYPPLVQGQAAYYLALNHCKKSLSLNLYSEEGKKLFRELAKTADIIVESFRPGIMQQIGIDYERLQQDNPRLIMVSVTGYGQDGPYSQMAGHDLNYIGYAGILGLTGAADGPPIIPAPQIADVAGGSYMTLIACLTALQQRQRTGKGDHVDVAMVDGVMPMLSLAYADYFATGQTTQRGTPSLSGGLTNYQVYACADGKHLALGALEPRFFQKFCEAVGHPEWVAWSLPGSEKGQELLALLRTLFLEKSQAEWLAFAEGQDFCLSPVYDLEEATQDPHLQARERFVQYEHPQYGKVQALAPPLKFKEGNMDPGWGAPLLGEDNQELLKDMGYSSSQVQELSQKGVI